VATVTSVLRLLAAVDCSLSAIRNINLQKFYILLTVHLVTNSC